MFSSNTTQVSDGGYQISRSLRFNSADSAYLNRTPASTTNRQIWTWSGWVKRGKLGVYGRVFQAREGSTGNQFFLRFNNTDTIFVTGDSGSYTLETTQVFRDPSAWYHIVFACDTTQATSSNRFKLYVNGSQVTAFGTATYPSQNLNTTVNSAFPHGLGAETSGPSEFFDGYITETYLIDGSQLTPSSFGETNAQTGVWQPKAYSGSYGTNGFYLNFSDNSNTTAATLGKDYSGNGNNWTPNNFSVTAGAGNDSLVDSPTSYGTDTGVGGTVRGNYCTLSPISSGGTMSNGNLDGVSPVDTANNATFAIPASGKWYFEAVMTNAGIFNLGLAAYRPLGHIYNNTNSVLYSSSGKKNVDNVLDQNYGASFTTGDIIGVACDADAGTITFYKNNTSQGALTHQIGGLFPSFGNGGTSTNYTVNFGQRPFAYTAPSGFKALCTQNLPTPAVGATTATQAGKYFNTVLYTGTGSSLGVTGVGFQPDWVWAKSRSAATDHALYDAVRGVQKQIETNQSGAETTETTGLTAFGSDGFTTGALAQMNTSSATYVAWNWKANGSGSSNTAGQITSTVSANTTSGFSVVTFTADGTTKTVGHGLGVKPSLVIVKGRNSVGSWITMTDIINGSMQYGALNSTAAFASIGYSAPTSTVFQYNDNNANTQVAYCFAEIAGYSKFGTYTGNSSTNGPFVYTGFRPAFVLFKRTDATSEWWMYDTKRSPSNEIQIILWPNLSDAEATGASIAIDILSNGFKPRSSNATFNGTGGTYIFMAFAESPQKFSLAR